jgi:hypothetical protein
MADKDLFAKQALELIPKILTLGDRNRLSPTYGCFDRNFWHYKIIDFPSGMAQEFVWPLALAHALDLPDNPYRNNPAILEWVRAGILFAARSAHPDGSCDDYFPFEKAGGAAAFSLLACIESCGLMGLDEPAALEFFDRRASWLANHHESGHLTNHQALIVLCLDRAGTLLGTSKWNAARDERLARVLEWQHPEGWFREYEGCDPGYHTLSISLLARIYDASPSAPLRAALEKAVAFAAEFVHPDGSFGGEYASRNTYNFFPHGFELFGRHMPEALGINDRILAGLGAGLGACHADDHILAHHAWNYLLAWRDFVPERPAVRGAAAGRRVFAGAGLLVGRDANTALFVALNKGGTFRFFRDGRFVASDTGVTFRMKDGRVAVCHLVGDYHPEFSDDGSFAVSGAMGWAKQKAMTPPRMIALRVLMLCAGRFKPDLVRKLLQRALITGKTDAPFRFRRNFSMAPGRLLVRDEVTAADGWSAVAGAAIGCDQTSIYVVMSRTFQRAQMAEWTDLTPAVRALGSSDPLVFEREL